MLTTRKLTPPVFRYSLIIATAMATLTGCDYFSDNWEIEGGKCQALSSEGNEIAIVSEGSVGFLKMDKGCPDNLDILGSRFTDIEINGDPYKATLLCSDATGNRRVTMLGTSENSASGLSARAMKEFTSFMGAKVTIEGESSRFYKGNFTKVCLKYLPRQTASTHSPSSDSSSLTLGDLLSNGRKDESESAPEPDPQAQMMAQAGYEKIDGEWRKKSRQPLAVTEQDRAATQRMREQGGRTAINLEKTPESSYGDASRTVSVPDSGSSTVPVLVELTPEIYGKALERAKSAWLLSHPGTDLSEFVWEKSARPDKDVNGMRLRVIRFTTTNPVSGVTSDIDVEIENDGTPGYALSTDRTAPSSAAPVVPRSHQATSWPINAFCTLDNGKNVGVFAAAGQNYSYTYSDKNDKTELELKEGLFGVKAFHYHTPLGMGAASYIRFNKGVYDYVLLSKDSGHEEFQGIRVYKNGDLISSHECKTRLELDTRELPQDAHFDSEKMGNYFVFN